MKEEVLSPPPAAAPPDHRPATPKRRIHRGRPRLTGIFATTQPAIWGLLTLHLEQFTLSASRWWCLLVIQDAEERMRHGDTPLRVRNP